jgi:hypothetical protein
VVLPLRDEGAISLGLSNLPGLFVGSLVLTLIAAPLSTVIFSLPHLSKGKVCMNSLYMRYPDSFFHVYEVLRLVF